MAIDIIDLLYVDGKENPSGLSSLHGIALLSDFLTIKKVDDLGDVAATLTSIGSISTPHVFKVGKCMKKVYSTENKGDHKNEVVGDTDSQGVKDTGTVMIPGSRADLSGMARLLNCSVGLFFTQESDGTVRQHGSERFPCHFKMVYATGNNEAYRGYTLTWQCYAPSPIYTPGLNFTPAVGP